MSNNSDIKRILFAWARWAKENDSMGYGCPMANVIRQAPEVDPNDVGVRSSRFDSVDFISDEKAGIIDGFIGVLMRAHAIDGQCLVLKYLHGYYPKEIANGYLTDVKYGKGSHRKVSEYVAMRHIAFGEGFISGMIAGI